MTRWVVFAVLALTLFRWGTNWRRVVGLTLVGAITVTLVFPAPVFAQFGVIGAIRNVLNIINGAIRAALDAIDRVSVALNTLYQSGKGGNHGSDRRFSRPDCRGLYDPCE